MNYVMLIKRCLNEIHSPACINNRVVCILYSGWSKIRGFVTCFKTRHRERPRKQKSDWSRVGHVRFLMYVDVHLAADNIKHNPLKM
jgi:hypothetical protein